MKIDNLFSYKSEGAQRSASKPAEQEAQESAAKVAAEPEAARVQFAGDSDGEDTAARARRVAELKDQYNAGKLSYDSKVVAKKVYEELF